MDNDEVVTLLREIRDLQKLHMESYKEAVRNQQTSIELQAKGSRLYKRALVGLLIFALLVVAALVVPSFVHH
ncbi:hypothetical protein [Granulicella tundricola]|uniref:hypothetical protein n=1 Tax=Granulicella tundricola TaxID=940615 RepID=UPI00059F7223|nr:hypothetical protein [Granulicella tundricola]